MKNTLNRANPATVLFSTITVIVALIVMSIPAFASAATYAYVDAFGDVKSVVANDWRTAINTAPNIHMHSGVMLLSSAADFAIVGDSVAGY